MFSFHIKGFVGSETSYWSDRPVDIKVFAESQSQAIEKAEKVIDCKISLKNRTISIEEVVGED